MPAVNSNEVPSWDYYDIIMMSSWPYYLTEFYTSLSNKIYTKIQDGDKISLHLLHLMKLCMIKSVTYVLGHPVPRSYVTFIFK